MAKKKRRKLKKSVWVVLILVLLFLLLLGSGFQFQEVYQDNGNNENIVEEPLVEVYTASMITAGDNLIHSGIYNDANKNANYNGYDFTPMYSLIKTIVSNYDIAYYNQETILGGTELGLSNYPTFNSPYEVGDAMIDAGFNLVSLATNHTLDKGANGVINSRNYWNSQEGVLAVGSYTSEEEKEEVHIASANGITYTMLNYTYGTNGIAVPTGKEYYVNVWPTDLSINNPEIDAAYQAYKETVKNDIAKVRDSVDVLIVAMHWGVEYTHEPTAYEKDMANFLAENGVDVIIGTHPHVIQPVTWIDDTLVIYSLGNFISAQYQNSGTCTNYKCTVGLMTGFTITKTVIGDDVDITIGEVTNELVYTYYNSSFRNFKIIPFSNAEIATYLSNYQTVYETYKQIVQNYDSEMYVVPVYQ